MTYRARGKDLFGDFVSVEHTHNIGKLMLAFTAFWAYIAFSQFMLIWIAEPAGGDPVLHGALQAGAGPAGA